MIFIITMNLNRKINYLGVEYTVVQPLDNELVLVVKDEDLQKGSFPLQTYVIPDPEYHQR